MKWVKAFMKGCEMKIKMKHQNIFLHWFLREDDIRFKSFILISFIIEYCHPATIIRVSFGIPRYPYELLFYLP